MGAIRRNRPSVCRVNTPGGRRNQNPRNTDGGGFSRTCGLRQFLSVLGGSNQPDAGSGMPHFDHGASFEACALAVKRGCTSIMIDGSALPFEENVALTKKVVEMAHACNVEVEGEIGSVGRNESLEGENAVSLYTEPEDAVEFARLTGVDALAVSIGTVHGVYKKAPKMDFERLAKIRSMIEIPLVMHGGSGLSVEDFHAAVSNGMNKINAFTNLSIAVADKIVEVSKSLPPKTITGPIYEAAIETGKQQVIQHIRLFGTRSIDS